jgi:lysophospholipase L1-like esterase
MSRIIQKYSKGGVFIGRLGATGTEKSLCRWHTSATIAGTSIGSFDRPHMVAIDDSNNLYAADTWNHRIQKFNLETGSCLGWIGMDAGGYIAEQWSTSGSSKSSVSAGAFNLPVSVQVYDNKYLIVAEHGNHRVQRFLLSGFFDSWMGASSTGLRTYSWQNWGLPEKTKDVGGFSNPYDAKVIGKSIAVADSGNQRVQLLSNELSRQPEIQVPCDGTIVWIGDSLFEQNLFTDYFETFYRLQQPQCRFKFVNLGKSADTAQKILARSDRDISNFKYDAAILMLGWNDGKYGPYDPQLSTDFRNGLSGIKSRLDKPNSRVWITAPPADLYQSGNPEAEYNLVLSRLSKDLRSVAMESGDLAVNLFDSILLKMKEARSKDPEAKIMGTKYPESPVSHYPYHPEESGHTIMAEQFISNVNWTKKPTQIKFILDQSKNKIAQQFTAKLPLLPSSIRVISKSHIGSPAPILNQIKLRIYKATAHMTYQVLIDDIKVGEYSGTDLMNGIEVGDWLANNEKVISEVLNTYQKIRAKNQFFSNTIFRGFLNYLPNAKIDGSELKTLEELLEKYRGMERRIQPALPQISIKILRN